MPSLFPELFDYAIFGGLVIRWTAALYFAFLGERLFRAVKENEAQSRRTRTLGMGLALGYSAVGVLLAFGLYTQGAELGGIELAGASLIFGIGRGTHPSERHVQILLMVMCLALLFLGAGPFAYDLPL